MTTLTDKLVTFRLGEDLFATDVNAVERVLRYTPATFVPDMPRTSRASWIIRVGWCRS
jgi:Chemotaxis signal transduction protein